MALKHLLGIILAALEWLRVAGESHQCVASQQNPVWCDFVTSPARQGPHFDALFGTSS
jgi:hypothetical protein